MTDNFLENAEEVRKQVLTEGTFAGESFAGHHYPGVDTGTPLVDVAETIEDSVGFNVSPKFAFWRLSKPGDPTPAPIHADGNCAEYAGLLYMSESPGDPNDGTAFWRNKRTGESFVRPSMRRGSEAKTKDYFEALHRESGDESKWDMTFLVKSKFNRFVSYPTHYFHSRYPFYSENYGETREEARLIWVVFFDELF